MKSNIEKQLQIIYALQQKYSDLHVGGSIGLYLHGIELSRDISNSDIDLCKMIDNINKPEALVDEGSPDFDYRFEYEGFKIELKIDKTQEFDIIIYNGLVYKVSKIDTITSFKREYADKGFNKHEQDLVEIEVALSCSKAK